MIIRLLIVFFYENDYVFGHLDWACSYAELKSHKIALSDQREGHYYFFIHLNDTWIYKTVMRQSSQALH